MLDAVQSAEDLVWHYTDGAGLIGMATEHILRASSVSFMNDPKETSYALSLMQEVLKEVDPTGGSPTQYFEHGRTAVLDEGFSGRYVACASRARDSLELWRAYGAANVAGTFAVGLARDEPLGLLRGKDHRCLTCGPSQVDPWTDIPYDSDADLVKQAVSRLGSELAELVHVESADEAFPMLMEAVDGVYDDLVATGKHESFLAERETRVTCRPTSTVADYSLRQGRFGPVAYVELTSAGTWGECTLQASRLPIREVIAWPGAPRAALHGIAAALTRGGHYHSRGDYRRFLDPPELVLISESTVPFV